eukprot:scaffold90111_cov76-Phaeocystis_antarctica.AAC.1
MRSGFCSIAGRAVSVQTNGGGASGESLVCQAQRLQSGGERTGSRNAGRSRVNGATEPMDRNECKG